MHTVVYYSTTKKTKILIYAITWLNTENIMFHGRSQVQKNTYGITPMYLKCPEWPNL